MKFLFFAIFFYGLTAVGQYNTVVNAELLVDENTEYTAIRARASNLVEVSQDLRFVFTTFRTVSDEKNPGKVEEEGGFSLSPIEKKTLSETTISKSDTTKIIVLFLVYDVNENLIGKARWSQYDEILEEKEPLILTKEQIRDNAYNDALINGIVTQDTRTKFGNDFYKIFYAKYFVSEINAEEIINIKEILGTGRNTKIEVSVEGQLLSEFFLRPKEDYLKSMADFTINNLVRYLQNKKNINNQIERY